MVADEQHYAPGTYPSLPPPTRTTGPIGWVRQNLLSTPSNVLLTLLSIALLLYILPSFLDWAIFDATWHGVTREPCNTPEGVDKAGACWTMVNARFPQFMYGFYPEGQRWRVDVAFILLFASFFALLVEGIPGKKWTAIFLFLIYPVI